ncbi:MAG TPA: VOC family protein [Armatimonadota bacterium]|nr:VOC family protein [Armatimonadota bacterium]
MIQGVAHIAVVTTDLGRAVTFYTEVLGFEETLRLETTHSGTIVFVSANGTQLELFGGGKPKEQGEGEGKVGYPHVALLVDDVDAEYERLRSLGVEFDMPPAEAEAGIRLAFFRDPDGNAIEIIRFGK